jgi:hypothetical protein
MPTLDDVYLKFGFTSEAAQLLETELGTLLLVIGAIEKDLVDNPGKQEASDLYNKINKKTLGQILGGLQRSTLSVDHIDELLSKALKERNRLAHSFYRQHNFRRNSDEGRQVMLDDLEVIHEVLLEAYKAVLLLSGIDLDKITIDDLPVDRVPI